MLTGKWTNKQGLVDKLGELCQMVFIYGHYSTDLLIIDLVGALYWFRNVLDLDSYAL